MSDTILDVDALLDKYIRVPSAAVDEVVEKYVRPGVASPSMLGDRNRGTSPADAAPLSRGDGKGAGSLLDVEGLLEKYVRTPAKAVAGKKTGRLTTEITKGTEKGAGDLAQGEEHPPPGRHPLQRGTAPDLVGTGSVLPSGMKAATPVMADATRPPSAAFPADDMTQEQVPDTRVPFEARPDRASGLSLSELVTGQAAKPAALTWGDAWSEWAKNPATILPFVGGALDMMDAYELYAASGRVEAGTATQEDLQKIQQFQDHSSRDQSYGYMVSKMAQQLPAFILEIFATGGLATAGRKGAQKALTAGTKTLLRRSLAASGKHLSEEALTSLASRKVRGAMLAKGLKLAAGEATRSVAFIPTMTTASTLRNMTGDVSITEDTAGQLAGQFHDTGDDFLKALAKGFGDTYIELLSEQSGALFSRLPGVKQLNALQSAVMHKWLGVVPGGTVDKFLKKVSEKTAWTGIVEEILEEEVGKAARGVTGIEEYHLTTLKELAAEATVFAMPGALRAGAGGVMQHRLDKAEADANAPSTNNAGGGMLPSARGFRDGDSTSNDGSGGAGSSGGGPSTDNRQYPPGYPQPGEGWRGDTSQDMDEKGRGGPGSSAVGLSTDNLQYPPGYPQPGEGWRGDTSQDTDEKGRGGDTGPLTGSIPTDNGAYPEGYPQPGEGWRGDTSQDGNPDQSLPGADTKSLTDQVRQARAAKGSDLTSREVQDLAGIEDRERVKGLRDAVNAGAKGTDPRGTEVFKPSAQALEENDPLNRARQARAEKGSDLTSREVQALLGGTRERVRGVRDQVNDEANGLDPRAPRAEDAPTGSVGGTSPAGEKGEGGRLKDAGDGAEGGLGARPVETAALETGDERDALGREIFGAGWERMSPDWGLDDLKALQAQMEAEDGEDADPDIAPPGTPQNDADGAHVAFLADMQARADAAARARTEWQRALAADASAQRSDVRGNTPNLGDDSGGVTTNEVVPSELGMPGGEGISPAEAAPPSKGDGARTTASNLTAENAAGTENGKKTAAADVRAHAPNLGGAQADSTALGPLPGGEEEGEDGQAPSPARVTPPSVGDGGKAVGGGMKEEGGRLTAAGDSAVAGQDVAVDASAAQKEAGNFKKGHVKWGGHAISVENPRGSVRKGVDEDGREWSQEMPWDYGYIKGTVGRDKDHLDVFLNPSGNPNGPVFVVNQTRGPEAEFDEHKVMLGFRSQAAATDGYLEAYETGWAHFSSVVEMSRSEFAAWSQDRAATQKPAKTGGLGKVEGRRGKDEGSEKEASPAAGTGSLLRDSASGSEAGTKTEELTTENTEGTEKGADGGPARQYFKGDEIRLTGKITADGFEEFVWLEGPKKGQTGSRWSEAERTARTAKNQEDWQQEQEGFRRLREEQARGKGENSTTENGTDGTPLAGTRTRLGENAKGLEDAPTGTVTGADILNPKKAKATSPAEAAPPSKGDEGGEKAEGGRQVEEDQPQQPGAQEQGAGSWSARTPVRNYAVSGVWRVVEADALVTSDAPGYDGSLQQRNRGKAGVESTQANREQIAKIAAELSPERLAESAETDGGAPLVDGRLQVVSGNGRTMSIRQAYEGASGARYRHFVEGRAKKLGIDVSGMTRPVLVREIRDTGAASMQEVAEDSNRDRTLQMSASEQARADGGLIRDAGFMGLYAPSRDGDVLAESNRAFLNAFYNAVSDGSLRKESGAYGDAIKRRVRGAFLGSLVRDAQTLTDLVDHSDDLGLLRVVDGIMASGGMLLKIADEKPRFDVSEQLTEALTALVSFKRAFKAGEVKTLEQWLGQQDMFAEEMHPVTEMLLRELTEYRHATEVRELFSQYASAVAKIDTSTGSLFGEEEVPETDAREALKGVIDAKKEEVAGGGQEGTGDLFGEGGGLEGGQGSENAGDGAGGVGRGKKEGAEEEDGLTAENAKGTEKAGEKKKVPAAQVRVLRAVGLTAAEIGEMSPGMRAERITQAETAAAEVVFADQYPGRPVQNTAYFYIQTGAKGAQYTLRTVSVTGGKLADKYVRNLGRNKATAEDMARLVTASRGSRVVYRGALAIDLADYEETAGRSGTADAGVVDRSDADTTASDAAALDLPHPTGDNAATPAQGEISETPRVELTGNDYLATHGLHVEERESKKGKKYWAVSGSVYDHADLLDTLKAAKPFKIFGKWTRSFWDGNPIERIEAALRTGHAEAPAEPEALPAGEAGPVLADAGLKVHRLEDGWLIKGETYTWRTTLRAAGGDWHKEQKGYWYGQKDGDPAGRVAAAIVGRLAGTGAGADAGTTSGDDAELERERRLRDVRKREDARTDERAAAKSSDGELDPEIAKLLGLDGGGVHEEIDGYGISKRSIPREVLLQQLKDAGQILWAFNNKKPAFVLANGAGTGKTFVLGAAIHQWKKAAPDVPVVYVTMNRDLIRQIKRDLSKFDLSNVTFTTYSAMSNGKSKVDPNGAILILDESHNVKNMVSNRGDKAQDFMRKARFVVASSATPYENPVEMGYLDATGLFTEAGGHHLWAQAYGAAVKRVKYFDYAVGAEVVEEKLYWPGGETRHGFGARQWLDKQGIFVQRTIQLDPELVKVEFQREKVAAQWVEMMAHIDAAYAWAMSKYQDADGNAISPEYHNIRMHQQNLTKRVLEASKIPFAISETRRLLAEGMNVVLFVETKADRSLGLFRKSGDAKGELYDYPAIRQMMAKWEIARRAADAGGYRAPRAPFADFIVQIANAFHEAGVRYDLPSTADEIVTAFGADRVAMYTGAVSEVKARANKDDFMSGKKPILVATMAKGGTGLSLHDEVGNRPTVQLNINLPWKASGVDQVAARTARLGLASPVTVRWLFAENILWESETLAPRVGRRMADMGALVSGIELPAAQTLSQHFDFEGNRDVKVRLTQPVEVEAVVMDDFTRAEALERGRRKASDTSMDFFPTPYPLAVALVKIAAPQAGSSLLEPSAGVGNLLHFVPEGVSVTAVEARSDNAGTLAKAYPRTTLHRGDFLEWAASTGERFDTVLMNPPFSREAGVGPLDAAHVRQAYDLLNEGGRLVAVMGEGVFFREQSKDREFREWLEAAGATVVQLPENTFKNSGTGVRARVVIVDKDELPGRSDMDLSDMTGDSLRDLVFEAPRRLGVASMDSPSVRELLAEYGRVGEEEEDYEEALQKQFDFAYPDGDVAGSDDATNRALAAAAQADLRDAIHRARRSVSTVVRWNASERVSSALPEEIAVHGYVDFSQVEVKGDEDIAGLFQIYRDPRWETFRVIYVTDDRIVGHTAHTAKHPSMAPMADSAETAEAGYSGTALFHTVRKRIRHEMQAFGATGYYLLHNHPSGDATPSPDDRSLTKSFADRVPGFLGHIVINHDHYSVLRMNKEDPNVVEVYKKKLKASDQAPSFFLSPTESIEALNSVPTYFALHEQDPGKLSVVFVSAKRQVRALQTYPSDSVTRRPEFVKHLREQAQAVGASFLILGYNAGHLSKTAPDHLSVLRQMVKEEGVFGYAHDVYGWDTFSAALNYNLHPDKFYPGERLYSLGEEEKVGATRDLSQARVTAEWLSGVVAEMTKGLKGGAKVSVVQGQEALPGHLQRADGRRIEGVYDPKSKRFYLVADNIRGFSHAAEVIAHEQLHHGLRGVVDPGALSSLMGQVYKARSLSVRPWALRNGYRMDTAEQRAIAAEEWLVSRAVTNTLGRDRVWWEKVLDLLRTALAKVTGRTRWTDADLTALVGMARESLRNGEGLNHRGTEGTEKRGTGKTDGTHGNLAREPRVVLAGELAAAKGIAFDGLFHAVGPARWYSRLYEAAVKLPNKGTSAQFVKTFAAWERKGIFRKAELQESGVMEWLAAQADPVSRQHVLKYLAETSVVLVEQTRTGGAARYGQMTLPGADSRYTEMLFMTPATGAPNVFTTDHWPDHRNVWAHARFDTRTLPNGLRVLHVAEIQSDAHQGRRAANADLPFAQNWHEVVLKRLMAYAADAGLAGVTWDTGATQIERSAGPLRQNADRIRWHHNSGQTVTVVFSRNGVEQSRLTLPLEGSRTILNRKVTLAGLLGEKTAAQIQTARTGAVDGNIQVGGKFHTMLYDQMLPGFANKHLKPHGISVTSTTHGGVSAHAVLFSPSFQSELRSRPQPLYSVAADAGAQAPDAGFVGNMWGLVKAYLEVRKKEDINARPDISPMDRLLRTMSHFSGKVPSLGELFEAGVGLKDNKYLRGNSIFNESTAPDAASDLEALRKFARTKLGGMTEGGRKLNAYLVERDRDQVGYSVKEQKSGMFDILNPAGVKVGENTNETAAWVSAFKMEAAEYEAAHGEAGAKALLSFRHMMLRQYLLLFNEAQESLARAKAAGVAMPMVYRENGMVQVDLMTALREMGDRRGYYFPRIRTNGQHILVAKKAGENPRLEVFDTKIGRNARGAKLKADGWTLTYRTSDTPSESAFQDAGVVAMQDLMNNALRRIEKGLDDTTLETLGVKTKRVTYTLKSGAKETHLVVSSDNWKGVDKHLKAALRELMPQKYDDGQTGVGEAYHWVNPPSNAEEMLLQRAHHSIIARQQEEMFAESLVSTLSVIIHSHGSRSVKIGRDGKTGMEVYRGYEEDMVKAATMSGRSLAGGTAKRLMARSMMKSITGLQESWKEYRDRRIKAENPPDLFVFSRQIWPEFQAQVEERRIDSATQPQAYEVGVGYMRDMLRNEEPMERMVGVVRGMAAVKYLSGISSGLVNMTALATTVPASMRAFGDIPLHRVPGLMAKGSTGYTKWWAHSKRGTSLGNMSEEDRWMFSQISLRGWDEAQFNQEAVLALQNQLQAGWSKAVNALMIVFSMTEKLNRGSTISAAYWGLKAQNKGVWDKAAQEAALTKAKFISDRAHGIYGKENLPEWARGSSIGGQVARSAYMFKTFTHNLLQTAFEIGMTKKDAPALAWMLISPMVLAGPGVLIGKDLLVPVIGAILSVIPGVTPPDDPEEWVYDEAERIFGMKGRLASRTGLLGLLGVNVKGSLSTPLGIADIPTNLWELLGAPASVVSDLYGGAGDLAQGEYLRGFEQLLPRMFAAPVRAAREAREGVTYANNQPVFYGDEPLRPGAYATALRMLGFNPAYLSTLREEQWAESKVQRSFADEKADIYMRVRGYYLTPESERGDAWAQIMMEMEAFNARVRRSGDQSIPLISKPSLQRIVKAMATAPRKERLRLAGAEEGWADDDLDGLSPEDLSRSRHPHRRNLRRPEARRPKERRDAQRRPLG